MICRHKLALHRSVVTFAGVCHKLSYSDDDDSWKLIASFVPCLIQPIMATSKQFESLSLDNNPTMTEPIPLVETTHAGSFKVNPAAAATLANIGSPLTVVGIAGRYREGKSYMANWFMGKHCDSTGFALGSTLQSKTKGIWFWCCPNPFHDGSLLILDTEGLEDPEKGNPTHDLAIFTFTVLMSSYFMLNSNGKIDDQSIQILQYPSM